MCTSAPIGRSTRDRCWKCFPPSRRSKTRSRDTPTGRIRGRRPSSNCVASSSATAFGTWYSGRFDRQEQLQQIVQEALPQIRRPDAFVVADDQPARLGLSQRLFRGRDLQARALDERADRKALGQAQRVHHELEHEISAFDVMALLDRAALGDALEIFLGLLPAHGPGDAIAKAYFAVGARADAEVIAEAPVVEIVAAFASRPRPGRGLVVGIAALFQRRDYHVLHLRR